MIIVGVNTSAREVEKEEEVAPTTMIEAEAEARTKKIKNNQM